MSIVETNVCIGGPLHGQRHQVEKGKTAFQIEEELEELRLPLRIPPRSSKKAALQMQRCATKQHTYLLSHVNGSTKVFQFWRHSDTSMDDLLMGFLTQVQRTDEPTVSRGDILKILRENLHSSLSQDMTSLHSIADALLRRLYGKVS